MGANQHTGEGRRRRVTVRLKDAELNEAEARAQRYGLTLSDYARLALTNWDGKKDGAR